MVHVIGCHLTNMWVVKMMLCHLYSLCVMHADIYMSHIANIRDWQHATVIVLH